jgi:5-methylcytosine-specific restriction protein B
LSRLDRWSHLQGEAGVPVVEAPVVAPEELRLADVPVPVERADTPALDSLLHDPATGPDALYRAAVSERLKAADEAARAAALDGPWAFKGWLVGADGIADGGEQPARNRLLHSLFPGSFEPIAAPEEKHAIADALGSLADDDHRDDVDHTLFAVRMRLEDLATRGELELPDGVDYFAEPLRETWDAGELGRGQTGLSHLDALRHKKQVVLYGPPGTGKTSRPRRSPTA